MKVVSIQRITAVPELIVSCEGLHHAFGHYKVPQRGFFFYMTGSRDEKGSSYTCVTLGIVRATVVPSKAQRANMS